MQIDVKEAARLLDISEKTIYRWIRRGILPAYRVNDQYRFNRAELLEWATARRINVSPEIFAAEEGADTPLPTLEEAIRGGGIHYRVGGETREDVLAAIVGLMQLPAEVDRAFLLNVLLARESLGSTGIGDGIAIPHVRNPIVLHIPASRDHAVLPRDADRVRCDRRPARAHALHAGEPHRARAPAPALPAHLGAAQPRSAFPSRPGGAGGDPCCSPRGCP